ncbi:MAG: hypothetical protein WB586_28640 [Chthoniobacterales bacterium]
MESILSTAIPKEMEKLLQSAYEAGKAAMRPLFRFEPQRPEGELMTVRVDGDIASISYGGRQYTVTDEKTLTLPVAALRWQLGLGIGHPNGRQIGKYRLEQKPGEDLPIFSFRYDPPIKTANELEQEKLALADKHAANVDKQSKVLEALLSKMAAQS